MSPGPVVARVRRFIRDNSLVRAGETLVVGVSGGPDSVCLLHVLCILRDELDIALHVAHLDHQLRGPEAEADAAYVLELAGMLGLPATAAKRDVRALRLERRLSLEEAAREARYNFFAEVAEKAGAGRVVVGHTIDDNIETILLHLVRGAGLRGLVGLKACQRLPCGSRSIDVLRPLLAVTREETADYCLRHALNPRLDVSNLFLSPLRNRIRHQLVPLLKDYNPAIFETLLRTARIAAEDLAYISEQGQQAWKGVVREEGEGLALDRALVDLHPALRRQVILMALEKVRGSLKDIELVHVDEIMGALGKPAGKRLDLPGALSFIIEYDRYYLTREPDIAAPLPPLGGETPLQVPGETDLPGWRVTAGFVERPGTQGDDRFVAYLDADRAGEVLSVRSRRRGDRFQPLGLGESKKVGEFMIDARIPRSWRPRIPVVVSPGQVVWLVGWRIDERVKVTGSTLRVLRLEFQRT